MGGTFTMYGRDTYNISVGKSEGKRPLERSRRRWEENIWLDLKEILREVLDCSTIIIIAIYGTK
jgi:hypothetical protein